MSGSLQNSRTWGTGASSALQTEPGRQQASEKGINAARCGPSFDPGRLWDMVAPFLKEWGSPERDPLSSYLKDQLVLVGSMDQWVPPWIPLSTIQGLPKNPMPFKCSCQVTYSAIQDDLARNCLCLLQSPPVHSFLGPSSSLDWQSFSKTPTSSVANSIWIASKSSWVFLKGCGCQNTTWYFAKAITSLM